MPGGWPQTGTCITWCTLSRSPPQQVGGIEGSLEVDAGQRKGSYEREKKGGPTAISHDQVLSKQGWWY